MPLHDDREPADLPVPKAAPVVHQRVVASNDVQARGSKPRPHRRALGVRFEQATLMGVAPTFIAVAVLFVGGRKVVPASS